ncbi:hypothetical protein AAG589_11220 [Isoptericola sp. F-RaC21]|uniref:hypothetical protein n=1 Tax=Isoptericola sp. F-RaC21 TaxID=3141452 RepID=UPI00315BD7C2
MPDDDGVRSRWDRAGVVVLSIVAGIVVLVLAVPVVVLWAATRPIDGERVAQDHLNRIVEGLADDVNDLRDPTGATSDPERVAAWIPDHVRLPDDVRDAEYVVAPVGWGRDPTSVDVVVRAEVPAESKATVFGRSRSAGTAESCWRLTVRVDRRLADREQLECGEPRLSVEPVPVPSLGPYAESTVLQALNALAEGASAADAEAALGEHFSEPLTVRAEREERDLVVAVGAPGTRDCVVGVRPDGAPPWRFSDFDRILLEPGELGCVPSLYTSPVTTH